jgi:hypothetical protein
MVHGWWRVLLVSDPKVYLSCASDGVFAIIAARLASICMTCMIVSIVLYHELFDFSHLLVPLHTAYFA